MKRAFRTMTKDELHSLHLLGRHGAAFLDGSTDVVLGDGYFEVILNRESTNAIGRARAFRILHDLAVRYLEGFPDRVRCYLAGLIKGWLFSDVIGVKDADDADESFGRITPHDGIADAVPDGHGEPAPAVEALAYHQLLEGLWRSTWMGIQNDRYYFECLEQAIPERLVLAWLGYLRGELEGDALSQAEYDSLTGLLPSVVDELTPFVAGFIAEPRSRWGGEYRRHRRACRVMSPSSSRMAESSNRS